MVAVEMVALERVALEKVAFPSTEADEVDCSGLLSDAAPV